MRLSRMITVVGAHAEGELNEVITGGIIDVPGASIFEKARYLDAENVEPEDEDRKRKNYAL